MAYLKRKLCLNGSYTRETMPVAQTVPGTDWTTDLVPRTNEYFWILERSLTFSCSVAAGSTAAAGASERICGLVSIAAIEIVGQEFKPGDLQPVEV
jgi:hypothetical protein